MRYFLDYVVILLIIFYGVRPKMARLDRKEQVLLFLFSAYLIGVYAVTLMPFRPLSHLWSSGFSFSLHTEAFGDVINSRGPAMREVLLNIIMFMPFGFLFPIVQSELKHKKVTFPKITVYSLMFSLLIEFLQMFNTSRSSDITDLITNTIGGVIGYMLYFIIAKPLLNELKGENKI
ncbi:VanZ family protein [Erysipelothrix urinaevulpis]|uniref:VanZ family protein n=1 Tax=Erysipelothrix urinaevulpis TaxID=2683717 RepID=UPI00135B626D|nr:VanZ family protein [Erysipelothrix urinaevulpis]